MTTATIDSEFRIGNAQTVKRLLAFAFDSSARQVEPVIAATRAVEVARAASISFDDVCRQLAPPRAPQTSNAPAAAGIILNFGRHRDRKLGGVARLDLGYLEWLATELRSNPTISEAADIVLDWVLSGGAA